MGAEKGTRVQAVMGLRPRRLTSSVAALLVVAAMFIAGGEAASVPRTFHGVVGVIVREAPDAGSDPEAAVERLGGTVDRQLPIINGFSADVPAERVDQLRRVAGVVAVDLDVPVAVQSTDATTTVNSLAVVREAIGASSLHAAGITGRGVDVAMIDTGVVPVNGLAGDNVLHGPDLSSDGANPDLVHLDTYGHGTHIAGIIAGDGAGVRGVAPDSRVISVKVADATGASDVSQIIAGIDWVVQQRNTHGRNIRVLNLSLGTDANQAYQIDPLAYAAEVAWRNGIVVVAAAGNGGSEQAQLLNPALDPFVIAVGAYDPAGTATASDDSISTWSGWGTGSRSADLVAPGKSVVSLRAPGSWIDVHHPEGRVNDRFFRGSGTSQATAVVSGAVALLLSANPTLTPDLVKAKLKLSADKLEDVAKRQQGEGRLDLVEAALTQVPSRLRIQTWDVSDGTGSLEDARGSIHVAYDGVPLTGEVTANGSTWLGGAWAGSAWTGTLWEGSTWLGSTWLGSTWLGSTWEGSTWEGSTWEGSTWEGSTWLGSTWEGSTWEGSTWEGSTWEGSTWEGSTWEGSTWEGATWEGATWQGSTWATGTWGNEG